MGTASHGQKRWIYIGSIGFQPSEFAKFVLIIFLASICGSRRRHDEKMEGHTARVFMDDAGGGNGHGDKSQHGNYHYGNCLHYHFYSQQAMAAVFCADGIRWWIHGDIFEACLIPGRRIEAWLNVETHPKGYQTRQSLYAIGSGGLFGRGYGKSIQKLAYIPEAHNDMIFSVICEEWGLLGAGIIAALFIFLIWRCLITANSAPDIPGALLTMGVTAHLGLQMLINIAVVTNSIPNTGIPLPFISYGGTSLIFLMCEIGIVQNIAQQGKTYIS